MTNVDIQKAREWAGEIGRLEGLRPGPRAAVEVIQSLPDRWIGVDEVREAINDQLSSHPHGTVGHLVMEDIACKLQTLLDPPLPTLADMITEELEACQWMQADHTELGRICITQIELSGQTIINQNGAAAWSALGDRKNITPLPGEPRLEWPAQEPHLDKDSLSGMWVDDGSSPSDAIESLLDKYEEHDLPRPEDVPPGEWWSVRYYGREWAGVRSDHPVEPWSVISMDGLDYRDVDDSEIILMFRLVPEIP